MIAIIDYGAGNLGSVYKALRYIGADVEVTSEPDAVERADALVLPGVGAFSHCMSGLGAVGLVETTKAFIASGRPFLGICVGLQMLFDESEEMGASPGLGVLPGRVVRFRFGRQGSAGAGETRGSVGSAIGKRGDEPYHPITRSPSNLPNDPPTQGSDGPTILKVPHIGWNALSFDGDARLFRGLEQQCRVYFVHSYYPEPADTSVVSATTEYGYPFCCAVEKANVHATQFHPEKSGAVGLTILRNFISLTS